MVEFQTITKKYEVVQFDGSREMAIELRDLLAEFDSRAEVEISTLVNNQFCVEFVNIESDSFRLDDSDWLVKDNELFLVYTNGDFEALFDIGQIKKL